MSDWRRHAVLIALMAAAFAMSWILSGLAREALRTPVTDYGAGDVWFSADLEENFQAFTTQGVEQFQTAHHPLSALMVRAPLRLALTLYPTSDAVTLFRLLLAMTAAAWTGLLFTVVRWSCDGGIGVALLAGLGALSSATALSWFAVPDTFLIGSLTTLPAIGLVALKSRGARVPEWMGVVGFVLSVSMVITNAMFGIVAAFFLYKPLRALQVLANGTLALLVLWVIQSSIFPSARFFFDSNTTFDDHLWPAGAVDSAWAAWNMLINSVVLPRADLVTAGEGTELSVHATAALFESVVGVVASAGWAVWLVGGLERAVRASTPFGKYLLFLLALQFLLHCSFAEKQTFLFAPHFLPLLICLAAPAIDTRRRLRVAAAVAVLALLAFNNLANFHFNLELAHSVTATTAVTRP